MQNWFLVALILSIAVSFIQSFFKFDLTTQRCIYWSCTCVATISGFFMTYPNWKNGIWLGLLFFGAMTVAAYCYTPYLKFGGKIYALTVQDSRADTPTPLATDAEPDPAADAYSGIITARKLWWLILPLMLFSVGNFYFFIVGRGEGWVAATGLALLVLLAVGAGYGDASWGYAIARGQYLQFVIASVVTVGLFAVLYLLAYSAGKRWPSRRQQSMEYRAHHRHR